MVEFTQDNINRFTNYLIDNPRYTDYISREDWEGLFNEAFTTEEGRSKLKDSTILDMKRSESFLYQYFMALDNFNIFKCRTWIKSNAFTDDKVISSIYIPANIEIIGYGAFETCINLKNVYIESGSQLEVIANYTFADCTSLEKIVVPGSVEEIGEYAFSGCTSLKTAIIGNPGKEPLTIYKKAFEGCKNLEEVTLGDKVTRIEKRTFEGCSNLEDIYFRGTGVQWGKILKDDIYPDNASITIHCKDVDLEVKTY